jgi:hypothetical protein
VQGPEFHGLFRSEEAEAFRKGNQGIHFAQGREGDRKKLNEFLPGSSTMSFGDIRRAGNDGPPYLGNDPKPLILRKGFCSGIDGHREVLTPLPGLKISVVVHTGKKRGTATRDVTDVLRIVS